ncbi:tyrosine-type recombinase/integrase [Parabacteroides chinchillae]|uniref:Site-specific recombinase XerD n=1 Tax=Parabacteroides chinchillae TaxID=871327 RepID=A0A8G2FCA7_9BACT|nr:site-specific integrase [Parabacteroides chinchillae]SEG27476.1 Site-specific recombinase XerD [Parabacteroides chinchillae]
MNRVKQREAGTDALVYMMSRQKVLESNQRYGTANLYRSAHNRFASFMKGGSVMLDKITIQMVCDFEDFLKKQRLSQNSTYTYISCIRAAYHSAVSEGLVALGVNPFSRMRMRPTRTHKRAISAKEIEEIAMLVLELPFLLLTRDIFVFSYMASGIPFIDLVNLKQENIQGDFLVYYRRKTNALITTRLTKGMRVIIQRYAGQGVDGLLFPILKRVDASYTEYKSCLRRYNRNLEKISNLMKNPVKLTSYTARHSWATEAKRQNTPVAVIGEALGHTSEKTTRFYLDSLDQSVLDKANMQIIRRLDEMIQKRKRE